VSDPGSGPPYPRSRGPGSNYIGTGGFEIGVSPIGTIPFDVWNTVLSQYANSPALTAIIQFAAQWFDQTENFDNFYDDVWDILLASGWGLDVWGRIVGVQRNLTVQTGEYFGFAEASPGSFGWNQRPFYSGQPATDNYPLSDDAFRLLILAKAAANICDGTIPAINQLLLALFPGRGNCYVQEGITGADVYFGFAEASSPEIKGWNQAPFYAGEAINNMKITYVFEFALTPVELALIQNSGVLPTPTGVEASIQII